MTSDIATRTPGSRSPGVPEGENVARWRGVLRWESALVIVLIGTLIFGKSTSPYFLNPSNFFYIGLNMGEIAIMALPLTLIIMTGEIDLSVASMLGLSGTVTGYLFSNGWSIWPAMTAAIVVGALGGLLNGVLVAKVGLPSIAVTIGTLTLFRGIAEILLAPRTITGFPPSLTKIGVAPIPGTQIAYSAAIFLVLALVAGVVLHATPLGRALVAIGLQREAAKFAGIRVNRIKIWLFVLSGVMCAFAGILFTLKNASVSYDAGTGLELSVVAIVLFGGVSIFGGRGSVIGVVLSVAIVGSLLQALTQRNVQPEVQNIIIGVLLLISVVIPNGGEAIRRIRERARRHA
ncbi:MAG TPA: ABC transporter permease [Streptosporangiaceae bacterium]|jgi:rhamnose transport system permease protein|nr:ABC transporter permease [Streptosporangiaceae bacterium]